MTWKGTKTKQAANVRSAADRPPGDSLASSRAEDPLQPALLMGAGEIVPAGHLTAQQIDDELMGDLGPPWDRHLAGCDLCGARVSEAAAPLAAFREVTLAWGERRSATLPLRPEALHRGMARSASFHPYLAWAASASLALAIGVAIPWVSHGNGSQTSGEIGRGVPPSSTEMRPGARDSAAQVQLAESGTASREEIVRDNQMLNAIDRDLAPSGDPDGSAEGAVALGLQPLRTASQQRMAHLVPVQD